MNAWLTLNFLLADDPAGDNMLIKLGPFLIIGIFFYFIVLKPGASERKKHQKVLETLKKNDRVVTAGGIIGTVANISGDGKEITLKVDDNTRIKFRRSSISSVMTDEKDDSANS